MLKNTLIHVLECIDFQYLFIKKKKIALVAKVILYATKCGEEDETRNIANS